MPLFVTYISVKVEPVPGQYVSSYLKYLNLSIVLTNGDLSITDSISYIYFKMEELKALRRWFHMGHMCTRIDLRHIPACPKKAQDYKIPEI